MTRSRWLFLALLTGSLAAAVVVATSRNTPRIVAATPRSPVIGAGLLQPAQHTIAPAGVVPKPSRELPPLSVAGEQKGDARVRALAEELRSRWMRNPDQLVAVVDHAARVAAVPPEPADMGAVREAGLAR